MERAKAELVVDALTKHFQEKFHETPDFFLADHNHEELSEGSWSIAWEGWSGQNPWTYEVTLYGPVSNVPEDVFLEPINSWCLGVFEA
jgi:hypothetical protein